MVPPQPPNEATDIFSLSDQDLAHRLQFIEEIGFGNWGSVWLCRPKSDGESEHPQVLQDTKIAVKLVHRSNTSTTAARVRSLWNEMKVVRSLKHEPHPSIISFYSFIITASYALVTMAFHPRLIPVEVPESHSKEWFCSLLSGVEFLHKRGVVHNDIKPANILLSHENVPVLVDFGFAERYDLNSSKAFHSNLSYGTPEYLSPERARGLPHDTRKSDVWSLGITFFEIIAGRTPFEDYEGEQFSTKEDLERYWARTMKGKWVGSWKMSTPIERLLRKMILPNADLRCNASQAMADPYWTLKDTSASSSSSHSHKKSASVSGVRGPGSSPSLSIDIDTSRLLDVIPAWTRPTKKDKAVEKCKGNALADKRNKENVPAKGVVVTREKITQAHHSRSQSQPKLQTSEVRTIFKGRKHQAMPSLLATLSPMKHDPPANPTKPHITSSTAKAKENHAPLSTAANVRVARKPFGPRQPTPPTSPVNKHAPVKENAPLPTNKESQRKGKALGELVNRSDTTNISVNSVQTENSQDHKGSVRNRVLDWERERSRLREMDQDSDALNEESVHTHAHPQEQRRERDQKGTEMVIQESGEALNTARRRNMEDSERYHRFVFGNTTTPTPPESMPATPLSPVYEAPSEASYYINESYSRSANESGLSVLRQSLKMSIDKTVRLYKSSAQALSRSTAIMSTSNVVGGDAEESRRSVSERASWEDEDLIRAANSSLPVVRHAVHEEQIAAANNLDRMTIWIRNVEKVVEDARQNFAASTGGVPLPPLPVGPASRRPLQVLNTPTNRSNHSNRSSRIPRKILAANQIFQNDPSCQMDDSRVSADTSVTDATNDASVVGKTHFLDHTLQTIPSEDPSSLSHVESSFSSPAPPATPSRARRATVVTRSPEIGRKKHSLEIDTTSPSKRREKSKSQNDLARPITPVTKLEYELERLSHPAPTPRLSAMVDRNLFIANGSTPKFNDNYEPRYDELTSSPLHVDPYPSRTQPAVTMDTPAKRRVEGVYDRFLMSTTGVKRVGRGYQSDNAGPVLNVPQPVDTYKRNQKFFNSTRRPMPPPVSSEDLRHSTSADEFGVVVRPSDSAQRDESANTVALVRRALKAITGKTTNSRMSRAM